MTVELRARCALDDAELSALHAAAFGYRPGVVQPWTERLEDHSLTWVGAFDDDDDCGDGGERLVGFANVAWDGGGHAFLLDVVVDPRLQRSGTGTALVAEAVRLTAEAGCEWLHVDFLPEHAAFYLERCGFAATGAGVIRLAAG